MLSEQQIRTALKDTVNSDKVDSWPLDYDFRKGGDLDSLDHVTFILRLAEEHGVKVPDRDIEKLTTIDAVLRYAPEQ